MGCVADGGLVPPATIRVARGTGWRDDNPSTKQHGEDDSEARRGGVDGAGMRPGGRWLCTPDVMPEIERPKHHNLQDQRHLSIAR